MDHALYDLCLHSFREAGSFKNQHVPLPLLLRLLHLSQVEDVAPPGVRRTFTHHHEWDGGASIAAASDSQGPMPSEEDPFNAITFDPDKCVKCGRCVAICQRIQGVGAIGFVGRGVDEHVSTTRGLPLDRTKCIECGQVRGEGGGRSTVRGFPVC